jgi:predicted dehydrogenase
MDGGRRPDAFARRPAVHSPEQCQIVPTHNGSPRNSQELSFMSFPTNRRQFLQTTAVAGIGYWVAGGVRGQESKSPNERIAMASIGIGGKGSSDSDDAGKFGDMVAICDVDEGTLNGGRKRFPKAKAYTDFRKMLDEMGSSIDAVTVSTADHTHAAASLMAMRMGKHCFCQKPLTHTIYEARLMAQVAAEKKVATQMGNQMTANDSLRKAAAVITSGVLGPVTEVHVWTNRPIWPQGGPRPKSVPCPSSIAWNLWLGPAPVRPYAEGVYHPSSWRGWWDFGTGALGDMACHTVNMPYMALNLRDPIAVQATCSGHNGDSYPKWSIIHFDYPALGDRPAVKLTWYDGGKLPPKELIEGKKMSASGSIVVGQKGKLYAPGDYAENGLTLLGGIEEPDVKWVQSPGHFEEWVRAIKGGEPAVSNFPTYAGGLTETILLGNLAVWAAATGKGERVEWDAKNMRSPNVAGLETIIKPIYRPGYTLDV